ncbi:hypothetical protein HPB50_028144 [Hyalomma asiaticum]|nr:hypothetical protein HPB50_028144 [Hyalomma asiaticum]
MANEEREKGSLHNKFTSDGRSIASVLQEEDKKVQMRRAMVEGIQRYVDDIGTVEGIKKFPFYIFAINILFEVHGEYYPLEIGLIEYSIKEGFISAFHRFINPGAITLGFASAAKDHSENTHGIPNMGFQEGTRDYQAVVNDFMTYLRLSADDAVLPPLFCKEEHIPQAEGCLRWLERGAKGLDWISLCGISCHSCENCEICCDYHLEIDNKNCALGECRRLGCDYHLGIDNKNCALGECRRLGYKMSNALLHAYRIEHPIDYQHLPARFDPSLNFKVFQMNLLLTEEEKAAYEAMANEEREQGSLHNKFTSDGRSIASVLQEDDKRYKCGAPWSRAFNVMWTTLELWRIKKFPFYIFAINMLCEVHGEYYPLEIGLIEYSIKEGFIRAFYRLINPADNFLLKCYPTGLRKDRKGPQ